MKQYIYIKNNSLNNHFYLFLKDKVVSLHSFSIQQNEDSYELSGIEEVGVFQTTFNDYKSLLFYLNKKLKDHVKSIILCENNMEQFIEVESVDDNDLNNDLNNKLCDTIIKIINDQPVSVSKVEENLNSNKQNKFINNFLAERIKERGKPKGVTSQVESKFDVMSDEQTTTNKPVKSNTEENDNSNNEERGKSNGKFDNSMTSPVKNNFDVMSDGKQQTKTNKVVIDKRYTNNELIYNFNDNRPLSEKQNKSNKKENNKSKHGASNLGTNTPVKSNIEGASNLGSYSNKGVSSGEIRGESNSESNSNNGESNSESNSGSNSNNGESSEISEKNFAKNNVKGVNKFKKEEKK